jgi:hypothetical protein
MQPIPLPSHGITTPRSGVQRGKMWAVRRPLVSRTIRSAPVATAHPYPLPSHTETHDVPDSSLITSVNPVAVQPGLNVDEDIERHIVYNGGGLWRCTSCNNKTERRRNRIRDHVADCLGHEIYRCTGKCGKATWCVALSVGRTRKLLDANYNVAVKSNAERVRTFTTTRILSTDNAHSGTCDLILGAFAGQ